MGLAILRIYIASPYVCFSVLSRVNMSPVTHSFQTYRQEHLLLKLKNCSLNRNAEMWVRKEEENIPNPVLVSFMNEVTRLVKKRLDGFSS